MAGGMRLARVRLTAAVGMAGALTQMADTDLLVDTVRRSSLPVVVDTRGAETRAVAGRGVSRLTKSEDSRLDVKMDEG